MTKLTTYTVIFRTDQDTASEEIAAASPEAALAEARAIADDRDRLASLYFEPYSEYFPVNEIEVQTPDGDEAAAWLDDDLRLRLVAREMLTALEKALAALNTAPRFKVPSLGTDSYQIAAECGQAIDKAKGDSKQQPPGQRTPELPVSRAV
jgi:hypothetical protein